MSALKKGVLRPYSGDGFGFTESSVNWTRHHETCKPGFWAVHAFMPSVKFRLPELVAVVDDFGTLVQVGVLHG